MNIWVVAPGEPTVFHPDMAKAKPMRGALLSKELARRGHNVIHWTGQFQHHDKRFLRTISPCQQLPNQPILQMVPSPGYGKNLSFARLRDHHALTRNWIRMAVKRAKSQAPDVILCSYPPVDLAAAVCTFAKRANVPVVLDLRDQWPDAIYQRMAARLHLSKIPPVLFGMNRMKHRALSGATGLTAISRPFLQWGLAAAGREPLPFDGVFHLAPPPLSSPIGPSALGGRDTHLQTVTLTWVGTLVDQAASRQFLSAVASLPPGLSQQVRVEIRGRGQLERRVQELAKTHEHIYWQGFADKVELSSLWSRTDWVVVPYDKSPDFIASIPNKIGEALSYGAHVLSPTGGESERLLSPLGVYHRVGGNGPDWTTHLISVIRQGPHSAGARRRAMGVHARHFDGAMIYPAFADHLEMVAAGGIFRPLAA